MPLGTAIHNIERTLGKGGQLAKAVGAVAKLIAKAHFGAIPLSLCTCHLFLCHGVIILFSD